MRFPYFLIFIFALACKEENPKILYSNEIDNNSIFKYAKGFEVNDLGDFKILTIRDPWPDSKRSFIYALIDRKKAAAITLDRDAYDAIILTPVNSIVVTSTTHLPALELLGIEQALVGFPGTDYVSSQQIRNRIDQGSIRELGQNENINTEILLELNPELVVGFGIDGTSKSLELIQKSDIPVIYNGDWVESSPLAKAEWIKFFGALFQKEREADSIFDEIEYNYINAKKIASDSKISPTVMSGALHKDIWYLPSGNSFEAQYFRDANLDYLWKNIHGTGSLGLSFEVVLEKANRADLWFSPSYYKSLGDLKSANPHYIQFDAFKNNKIYSFVNRTGKSGGVLYFELGTARPDLVLKDIIKIAHPTLLSDYETTFFTPLE